mmetsp:Transcript_10372/g.18293  ORF Transcript_10372/g.18293 Transcript_10372/m.18293 type:complete len:505 (-) Transcript_10372:1996-3510(-)
MGGWKCLDRGRWSESVKVWVRVLVENREDMAWKLKVCGCGSYNVSRSCFPLNVFFLGLVVLISIVLMTSREWLYVANERNEALTGGSDMFHHGLFQYCAIGCRECPCVDDVKIEGKCSTPFCDNINFDYLGPRNTSRCYGHLKPGYDGTIAMLSVGMAGCVLALMLMYRQRRRFQKASWSPKRERRDRYYVMAAAMLAAICMWVAFIVFLSVNQKGPDAAPSYGPPVAGPQQPSGSLLSCGTDSYAYGGSYGTPVYGVLLLAIICTWVTVCVFFTRLGDPSGTYLRGGLWDPHEAAERKERELIAEEEGYHIAEIGRVFVEDRRAIKLQGPLWLMQDYELLLRSHTLAQEQRVFSALQADIDESRSELRIPMQLPPIKKAPEPAYEPAAVPPPPPSAGPRPKGQRPTLGMEISVADDDQGNAESLVIASTVTPGGPAELAGVEAGDIIYSWDGKRMDSWKAYRESLKHSVPGSTSTLTVIRNGTYMQIQIEIGSVAKQSRAHKE